MSIQNILVVEDQAGPIKAFEFAFGQALRQFIPKPTVTWVTNLQAAKEAISKPGQEFEIIFLDHCLPRVDVGDLEKRDFEAFSNSLEEIGYKLIPEIRKQQPKSMIVGTSSMSSELEHFPHRPDATLDKCRLYDSTETLESLLHRADKKE